MNVRSAANISVTNISQNSKWNLVPLSDICNFVRGVGFEKHEMRTSSAPGHLPVLRAGNIQAKLDTVNDLVWVPKERIAKEQRLHPGDIAICLSSGSPSVVGKTAQLLESFDGSVGAFCGIIRPRDPASAGYLGYWFRSGDYLQWRDSQARGANIQNLRFSNFESVAIPWPPLAEQKRIAAILTEQMEAVEKARVATEKQLEAAHTLSPAWLRRIFDSSEARQWPVKKLGDLLHSKKEIIHPRDNPRGPAQFVGLEHIESGTGVRIGSLAVEMSALAGRKPCFSKGDIVYGYLRPYLNKVWIAEFNGLCSVDQYVYTVDKTCVDAIFVAWFMRSPVFLERAPINLSPGQLPRIRLEEVAQVPINLPPLQDQQRIGAVLAAKMANVRRVKQNIKQQMDHIALLSPALLRKVFSGGF